MTFAALLLEDTLITDIISSLWPTKPERKLLSLTSPNVHQHHILKEFELILM